MARAGPRMNAQDMATTLWSAATLRRMPGAEAWAALETAVVRVGPGMNAQGVASTLWSVAMLGLMPGAEARAALEAAAARVAKRMNAQDVATTLWSVLTLAATRGIPLPTCYPAMLQLARGFDVGCLRPVETQMMFHAYLIHTERVDGDVLSGVAFPP